MRFIVALLLVHLYGQTEAAQCACSTGNLNVRSGTGTSHDILHVMQTGECATYLGESSQAEDLTWLHLNVAGQTGWAASNWLHVGECSQTEVAQCACSTGSLNVRSGAGTSHDILHVMQTGECATYLGQSSQAEDLTWLHLNVAGQTGWAASNWLHIGVCSTSTSTNTGTSSVQLSGCPHIVTRAEWGARAPTNHIGNMAALPIYVFVHHGDGGECFDRASCIAKVKIYQDYHMDTHGWPDIGYNFVVGEDGNAYEARGWSEIGAHTLGYNNNGIAICVIGNFNNHVPNEVALKTVQQLIQCGLANGKINPNYTLKGHRDVGSTDCPGTALYNLIHSWPHYTSGTALYG